MKFKTKASGLIFLTAILIAASVFFINAQEVVYPENIDPTDITTFSKNSDWIIDNWEDATSVQKAWVNGESNKRANFWTSLTDKQKEKFWNEVLWHPQTTRRSNPTRRTQLFTDLSPEESVSLWNNNKLMTSKDKDAVWQELHNTVGANYNEIKNKQTRNNLWKELDKTERNRLLNHKTDDGKSLLDDVVKNELLQSLNKEDAKEMIHQMITSKINIDKLTRKGINIKPEDFSINFGQDFDPKNLLIKDNQIINKIDNKDGGFLYTDSYDPTLKKAEFKAEGLLTLNYEDNNKKSLVNLEIGTIRGNKFELPGYTDSKIWNGRLRFPEVTISENGEYSFKRDGTLNLNSNNDYGVAKANINGNEIKQFYSMNGLSNGGKYYKSKSGEDEPAIIDLGLGPYLSGNIDIREVSESPSDAGQIEPKVKNTIITFKEEGKTLGKSYLSRREFTTIISQDREILSQDNFGNYIQLTTNNDGKLNLKMVSNNYAGFITSKGVDIASVTMDGAGGDADDGRGKYLYLRNGDFGVTVNAEKTLISGRPRDIQVSVDTLANKRDPNQNTLEMQVKPEGNLVTLNKDKPTSMRVSKSSRIWKQPNTLEDIISQTTVT